MLKVTSTSIVAVFVVLITEYLTEANGLKCYQCMYVNNINDGIGNQLPPGFVYGNKCSKSKMPSDWLVECSDSILLNNSSRQETPPDLTPTCGKYHIFAKDLPIWIRGCVPKAVVADDNEGICKSRKLGGLMDDLKDLIPLNPEFDRTINVNSCHCDEDGCNSAMALGAGADAGRFVFSLGIVSMMWGLQN